VHPADLGLSSRYGGGAKDGNEQGKRGPERGIEKGKKAQSGERARRSRGGKKRVRTQGRKRMRSDGGDFILPFIISYVFQSGERPGGGRGNYRVPPAD
jgi:hypothetical protein